MAEVILIHAQPEDATYEEIMRELAFERMIERGLADSCSGNIISTKTWSAGFELGISRPVARAPTKLIPCEVLRCIGMSKSST